MNIVQDMTRTTIVLDTDTRERLKKLGSKGESYDQIVLRLLDFYETKLAGQ